MVSRLHERIQVPQFELLRGGETNRSFWAEIVPADRDSWLRDYEGDLPWDRAYVRHHTNREADEEEALCARQALRLMLERVRLPTDEVDVPDGPPATEPQASLTVTIGDRQYALQSFEAMLCLTTPEPVFKRGECGCGRCFWDAKRVEWYLRTCDGVAGDTYCHKCGSLLGPDGWAMLAGQDPKDVQWPEEVGGGE